MKLAAGLLLLASLVILAVYSGIYFKRLEYQRGFNDGYNKYTNTFVPEIITRVKKPKQGLMQKGD